MLQTYKDEVDTLNEALKIAAMDIAEVAEAEDEYFISDDEDDDDEDISISQSQGDDTLSVSAASESVGSVSFSSARETATAGGGGGGSTSAAGRTSKETLYREALRDSSTAGNKSATHAMGQQKTFVVKEDGSFDKK